MKEIDWAVSKFKRFHALNGKQEELHEIIEDAQMDFETDYNGFPVCRAALKPEVFVPFGYQQKYRCPYCRLADRPAYGYKDKQSFRQHTQVCQYNPRRTW